MTFSCPIIQRDIPSQKIAIIGAGLVGSTTAYTLMLEGVASDIVLIDADKDKAVGQAYDLRHCMQFTRLVSIESGDSFELVKGASVIIICAGIPQKPGQSRLDLLNKNLEVFKNIIPKIIKHNDECILLVVTNPLDVLTYVTLKLSQMPVCRVFGTGTVLDTSRLRFLLGQHLHISPKDITAYVLGEHGDSEFVWWSMANVAGIPLSEFSNLTPEVMNHVCHQTQNSVYEIIKRKGATYYAIAIAITRIVRAIVQGQSRVFTLSTYIDTDVYGVKDVCMSVPTIIGQNGVCQRLDIKLDSTEQQNFINSANKIQECIKLVSNSI